jgi:cytosine/adenosine deaminase-related metal-dependent hydrolase
VPNETTLLTAAWVATMDRPIIRDGAVVFEGGKILAAGPVAEVRAAYPDASVTNLGDVVLLPGLINAHTHLELSNQVQGAKPDSFVGWILDLMSQTARTGAADPTSIETATLKGVAQCLRFGVTTVGDISKQCMFTRPVLKDGPIRVVSYGEIQAMAQRRKLLDERFTAASDVSHDTAFLRVGVTPHAPYTVEPDGYARCVAFSRQHNRPLATHLAETPDEQIFLETHTGPFRHLWEAGVNAWDDDVPKYKGGPIRFARDVDLLSIPTLLAHVNYCDDDELKILAEGKASVVYCPRTHAYFGHPPHRWREMLLAGVNVAVGTDSCASSPDLNIVDDLRLLRQIAPEMPADELWAMATTRAAIAINAAESLGSIALGKFADFTVFPAPAGDSPLAGLLDQPTLPTALWIGGKKI